MFGGLSLPVEFVAPGELERFDLKADRWVDERGVFDSRTGSDASYRLTAIGSTMTNDSDSTTGRDADAGFVYRFTTDVAVQFRDLNAIGHVNNAVYMTYIETALARYYETVIGKRLSDISTAMVSLDMEFHRAITEGDE